MARRVGSKDRKKRLRAKLLTDKNITKAAIGLGGGLTLAHLGGAAASIYKNKRVNLKNALDIGLGLAEGGLTGYEINKYQKQYGKKTR